MTDRGTISRLAYTAALTSDLARPRCITVSEVCDGLQGQFAVLQGQFASLQRLFSPLQRQFRPTSRQFCIAAVGL